MIPTRTRCSRRLAPFGARPGGDVAPGSTIAAGAGASIAASLSSRVEAAGRRLPVGRRRIRSGRRCRRSSTSSRRPGSAATRRPSRTTSAAWTPPTARAAVDLIYREYCLAEADGRAPVADAYVARFPRHAEALRRLFQVHGACSPSLLHRLLGPPRDRRGTRGRPGSPPRDCRRPATRSGRTCSAASWGAGASPACSSPSRPTWPTAWSWSRSPPGRPASPGSWPGHGTPTSSRSSRTPRSTTARSS